MNVVGYLLVSLFLGLNSESYHVRRNCAKILDYQPSAILYMFKGCNPSIEQMDHIHNSLMKRKYMFPVIRTKLQDWNEEIKMQIWTSRYNMHIRRTVNESSKDGE